jgi:hypothetical protein
MIVHTDARIGALADTGRRALRRDAIAGSRASEPPVRHPVAGGKYYLKAFLQLIDTVDRQFPRAAKLNNNRSQG